MHAIRRVVEIATLGPGATAYVDTEATPDTTHDYTLVAEDTSGNTATATATVMVPHDMRGKAMASNGYNNLGNGFDDASQRNIDMLRSARWTRETRCWCCWCGAHQDGARLR